MGYESDDINEPWHDVDVEQLANSQLNGVIGGCALTYSGSTMAVTMGAGTALINGVVKQITSDGTGVTLVADGSNKRWAIIGLTSSGAMALVSGTAAASSSVEASKPEAGSIVVPLGMVKIEAAQTIANSISVKLDKRIPIRSFVLRKTANETVNTSATLQNDDDLYFYMNASEVWVFELHAGMNSGSTPNFKWAWTLQSGGAGTASYLDTAAGNGPLWDTDITSASAIGGQGAAASFHVWGVIVNSSTAGLQRIQWAQNTSDASDTILLAGTYMVCRRIA